MAMIKGGCVHWNFTSCCSVGCRCTPPELLREATASESKYTEKSDVWQYGMLLWEVMTNGMEPYKGKKDEEVRPQISSINCC
jgi:DNA-binding helix-hairpin-helix protein with protein kinase domain